MANVHFFCVLCGTALQAPVESRYDLTTCPGCSRYVPVPRPVNLRANMTSFQPVFPPDVLELSVKFQCSACRSVLHADARCEGREVLCPTCGIKIGIPRWSNVLSWPRTADGAEKARTKGPHASGITAPTLSMEEIDFLRGGGSSRKPEATS